jgi:hypothetical protein
VSRRRQQSRHARGAARNVDREKQRVGFELSTLKKKYDEALRQIKAQDRELAFVTRHRRSRRHAVSPSNRSTARAPAEGTVVVLASDWHVEERVDPGEGQPLNKFTTDIAQERARDVLPQHGAPDPPAAAGHQGGDVVLALLGDFITNDIHEETRRRSELAASRCTRCCSRRTSSCRGIQFMLEHSTA